MDTNIRVLTSELLLKRGSIGQTKKHSLRTGINMNEGRESTESGPFGNRLRSESFIVRRRQKTYVELPYCVRSLECQPHKDVK